MYRHGNQQLYGENVWDCILHNHIIGSYILKTPPTGNTHRIFLQEVFFGLFENVPLAIGRLMWYKHDGVPVHFHIGVRYYLDVQYPNPWIRQNGPVSSLSRSPDMNDFDFCYLGYMRRYTDDTPVESDESHCKNCSGHCR